MSLQISQLTGFNVFDGSASSPPLAGLWGWWKVDGGSYTDAGKTTLCTNTDSCYTLSDFSGNGNDLIQATSGNRPIFTTGELNGYSSLVFDGSDDEVTKSTGAVSTDLSFFAVFKNVTWSVNELIMGVYETGVSGGRYISQSDTTPEIRSPGPAFNNSNLPVNTYGAIHSAWNSGASAMFSKINNTSAVTGTFSQTNDAIGFRIGTATAAGGGLNSNISVCEVLLYSGTTITDGSSTQKSIMNYLSSKYNLGWTL